MKPGARERLVFATRNAGKLTELGALIADLAIDVCSLDDLGVTGEVVEDGETFHDNARKKAVAARDATGLIALADDSGLEVDALGGAPGVRSARYAGDHLQGRASDDANNARLLGALANTTAPRTARFRCVLALARPGQEVLFAEGTCEGTIAASPRGSLGFGYDPLFIVEGTNRTLAELALDEKNRFSHRGHAMRALVSALRTLVTPP